MFLLFAGIAREWQSCPAGTVVKLVRNYFSGDEYIPYHEQAKMLKGDK